MATKAPSRRKWARAKGVAWSCQIAKRIRQQRDQVRLASPMALRPGTMLWRVRRARVKEVAP